MSRETDGKCQPGSHELAPAPQRQPPPTEKYMHIKTLEIQACKQPAGGTIDQSGARV